MGVRQLETFVKNYVKNGYLKVSLANACEQYKNEHKEKPILLFDFYGFLSIVQCTDEETLCGGRSNKLNEIFEGMLKKLSEIAELVFFLDGPVVDNKLQTWIDRHGRNYADCIEVMERVYAGESLKQIVKSCPTYRTIPKFTMQSKMMEDMARKYGTLHVSFNRECDSEMVRYAVKNPKVLAIVADDSDFLIFPGNWRYFSLRSIDFSSTALNTFEYNRHALRSCLGLSENEMLIVSTLNGNDIISYDDAQYKFHTTLQCNYRSAEVRFHKLAQHARRISKMQEIDAINEMSRLLDCSTKMIKDSLEMYNPDFKVTEIADDDALKQFCRDKYFKFTYAILINSPIHYTCNYFDLTKNDVHNAKVELFQKQLGVILANDEERKNADYQIVTKRRADENYMVHLVKPKVYHAKLPPLLELLNRADFPLHNWIRFDLLKWMIGSNKLDRYDLRKISQKYLHDLLTLLVLRENNQIDEFEADLILLTIKDIEDKNELKTVVPEILNERAFRITFLFSKFHGMIDNCFQVTGLKDISKLINFDGVHFHNLYLLHLIDPYKFPACLNGLEHYRIYTDE